MAIKIIMGFKNIQMDRFMKVDLLMGLNKEKGN